jgi:outer membrane immunogenic protein
VAAPFSWTGCYVGGHVGAGWARADISDPTGSILAPFGSSVRVDSGAGFLGGGQVGCDYQFANNWVIGAAGDFSWASINGQANDPFFSGKNPGPITVSSKIQWLATATARLGYTWDRLMVYGKGGAAWNHTRLDVGNLLSWGTSSSVFVCTPGGTSTPSFIPCAPSGSDTRLGWTVGFGLAWAFAPGWSAGVEFDHYDFGSRMVTLVDTNSQSGGSPRGSVGVNSQRVEAVKFVLDYHLGGGR